MLKICIRVITHKPYGIYSWNFTDDSISYRENVSWTKKTAVATSIFFIYPPLPYMLKICVQLKTPKLYWIYSWNFTDG